MSAPRPSLPAADRNLLFGILALQMDFISRDALIQAMNAWVLEKAKPLGQILLDQSQLSLERLNLLNMLVQEHLKAHQSDPQASLAALILPSAVRQDLLGLGDNEVHASLVSLGSARAASPEMTVDEIPAAGLRYRILRPHAKGGLGEVFVALDEELHREVALKEIQKGHAPDAGSRARFLLEAEITGGLEHPGIVPVYGLGQYDDGRPFYAMRFIKGDNLKEAIRRFHEADVPGRDPGERSLALRQLLGRFVDVCNAVAYAHSRGVLHRDLKPGNIMLGRYGETLLVDWGLAKAAGRADSGSANDEATLKPSSGSDVVGTQAGTALGTPAYMSPEQAAGRLDQVGPASDVYSLGATLYCLLTGKAPFGQADKGEVLRLVQKGDFPSPRSIKASVPAALEAICLKAMALRPEARYATALALSADVEHWLADEPVSAHSEPLMARLTRWGRKHRTLVTSFGAVLLVATIGSIVALILIEKERENTAKALIAETKAKEDESKARAAEKQARDKAMAALRAMTDDIVENQMARGTQLTEENKEFLRKIIRHFEGLAAVTANDAESRAIRAEGYARVGLMRVRLGELKEAETAFSDALALQQQLVAAFPTRPEFSQDLAKGHNNLGNLLSATGRPRASESAYTEALAILRRLAADFPDRPEFRHELASSHSNLGNLVSDTGRPKEAEAAYTDALGLHKQLVAEFPTRPEFRQELAKSHNNLGILLRDTGRMKEAEAAYGQALALQQQLADEFPTQSQFRSGLAATHNNLGGLFRETGRLKDAEIAFTNSQALRKQLAADFPSRPEVRQELAQSHQNLSILLKDADRMKEAEATLADALALQKQLAADFPSRTEFRRGLASSHNILAILLFATGRLKEAKAAHADALNLQKQLVAEFPTRPDFRQELAGSHNNLGILLRTMGQPNEAEAAYASSLTLQRQLAIEFPTRPDFRGALAKTHDNMGLLLRDMGRLKEAEAAHGEALALQKQLAADFPNQPDLRNDVAGMFGNLAVLHLGQRDYRAAKANLEQAAPHHNSALKAHPQNPTYRQFYQNNMVALIQTEAGLGHQAGSKEAAEKLRDLGWNPPGNGYDAACGLSLCIPIVEKDNQATKEAREQQVRFYGDEAMKMLRDATAKGYKDAAHMNKDPDLDPLREREDFKKLLEELEGKK